ncbi:MAG: cupredoxin domain-containing protein [Actinomycetota bacterium]|nr:cupredoxin domain-containing protein [Actinomycetota bacterium]
MAADAVAFETITAQALGWKRLLDATAVAAVVGHAAIAAALTDLEAGVFTVLLALGAALARRRPKAGAIVLALLFADLVLWTAPASWSALAHGDGLDALLLQLPAAALGVVGLVAAVAVIARRSGHRAPLVLAVAVAVAVAGAISVGTARVQATPAGGGVEVALVDTAFNPTELTVDTGTTVSVRNDDYFWHTFTVPELGLEVRVPGNTVRELRVDAEAGTYAFLCRIPGHDAAGMTGNLTVTAAP